jgi:hypothetical protein
MSVKILLVFLFFLFATTTIAQTSRVLIVGDSWAQLQIDNNSHNQIFSANGFAQISIASASDTVAADGKTAADWAQADQLQIITDILNSNSQIDTVQLTIGGNDFLDAWNINMTMLEQQALQQQIKTDLTTIAQAVLAVDNTIEVVFSFYDYPNFVDTIGGLFGGTCNDLLTDMGVPTVSELNTAAVEFEQVYAQIAQNNPRIYHVSHFGLMQTFFGFPDEGILPGDIMVPGDITRPSPVEAMRDFVLARDCFHLSPQGYEYLVQDTFDGYFHARFDTVFKGSFE